MNKNILDKENTIENNEKDNAQLHDRVKNNFGSFKFFLAIILFLILLGLGFYYNIIQKIFYSFLSIIIIIIILVLGISWEYIVIKYLPIDELKFRIKDQNNNTDSWKKIEEEFDQWIANSEQKIIQLIRLSMLNYMTSIGLFVFSLIILLTNWIYDENLYTTANDQFNPAFALTILLVLFSLIFMFFHYVNQKDIIQKQEKLDKTIQWLLSVKTAHFIGKEKILEIINPKNEKS